MSRRKEATQQDRLLQVRFSLLMLVGLVLFWVDNTALNALGVLCMLGAGALAVIGFHRHGFRK